MTRADGRRAGRERPAPDTAFGPTLTGESLFDAMGVGLEGVREQQDAPPSELMGWAAASLPADERFLAREAHRIVSAGGDAFERLYRTFLGARAMLGLALVVAQALGQAVGVRDMVALAVSLVYGVQAISMWLLPRWRGAGRSGAPLSRLSRRRWVATIGFDLLLFSILHAFEPMSTFNYVALLVLPVLMAGVLTSRMAALATAAAASLMLLAAAWRTAGSGVDPASVLTPAGLTGIGLFVVVLLSGELAGRLAREELAARGSLELARQQAQLNRLVIEEMADGVLVIDRRARVRAANPAARRLLAEEGLTRAAPFQLQDDPAWSELAARVLDAFEGGQPREALRDATLHFVGGQTRTLRLRARFTRPRARAAGQEGEVFCVLFVEDLRRAQERIRQEKLAAMGRVSAGIAHEIRNPLAAIAQANALLGEQPDGPDAEMLSRMIADNVERLKRIVDDVMEVAPGHDPNPRAIDLGAEVGRIVTDWARTSEVPLGGESRLQVELPVEPLAVLFDAEHLRRVLVNLLDNARRYASQHPGAIRLSARSVGVGQARLAVASDGDPIPPDIEPYLFEPFFSTRSRGTGLGLYICRELCERYGGSIDYRQHPQGTSHRNEFIVSMRVAPHVPDAGEGRLP
ncbi:MAG TPA: ATP-binding protein [Burkholderiaceae bacterium]|nr:ATP-binding protein [Burkholderiaceae bacterium]